MFADRMIEILKDNNLYEGGSVADFKAREQQARDIFENSLPDINTLVSTLKVYEQERAAKESN
jgi:hypothetical protein